MFVLGIVPGVVFITYDLVQQDRVFALGKPLLPSVMKHSNLLGPFLSNKENEVL